MLTEKMGVTLEAGFAGAVNDEGDGGTDLDQGGL